MKIRVIGCGSIGRRHIQNLLTLGVQARDISVHDTNPETTRAVTADFGVEQWFDGHADAVLICTPARDHAVAIGECIERRVPFFVEKPATVSVASLHDHEWLTTVPHLVGCNMLFRPEVERILQDVEAECWASCRVAVALWCESDMAKWPGRYVSPPVFEFCHEIDIALRMDPAGFSVVSFHRSRELVTISMKGLSRNLDVKVHLGWAPDVPYSRGARISTGSKHYESGYAWSKVPDDVNQMYLDEMWHFMAVASRREKSRNTLADARRVVEICEKAST